MNCRENSYCHFTHGVLICMLLPVDMFMYTYLWWFREIVIIQEGEMCTSGLLLKNWKHSKWVEDDDMMLPKQTCEEVTYYQSKIHFPLCMRLKIIWAEFKDTSSTSIKVISNGLSIWEGACKRKWFTNWEGVITQLDKQVIRLQVNKDCWGYLWRKELWSLPQHCCAYFDCFILLVRNHCNQFTYISSWREIVRNEAERYLRELE